MKYIPKIDKEIPIKIINHPGFEYYNKSDNETQNCSFPGKVAIVGKEGAFFGSDHVYLEFEKKHNFSCLSVFRSRKEAEFFIKLTNNMIQKSAIAKENLRIVQ